MQHSDPTPKPTETKTDAEQLRKSVTGSFR